MKGKPKPRQGKGMLAWRSRQKPGAIMKPSTFKKIERKAEVGEATNPEKVAGAAYWKTVEAKYKKSTKGSPPFTDAEIAQGYRRIG